MSRSTTPSNKTTKSWRAGLEPGRIQERFWGSLPWGKPVRVNGMSVQRIVGGKMVEGWDNREQLSLLVQLGAVLPAKLL